MKLIYSEQMIKIFKIQYGRNKQKDVSPSTSSKGVGGYYPRRPKLGEKKKYLKKNIKHMIKKMD